LRLLQDNQSAIRKYYKCITIGIKSTPKNIGNFRQKITVVNEVEKFPIFLKVLFVLTIHVSKNHGSKRGRKAYSRDAMEKYFLQPKLVIRKVKKLNTKKMQIVPYKHLKAKF